MKTHRDAAIELWAALNGDVGMTDVSIAIKTRDAEHAAQLAAAERTIEQLRATRQGLLDDLVKAAGREIALQETIEQLGQDAAAIAGRLDRAVIEYADERELHRDASKAAHHWEAVATNLREELDALLHPIAIPPSCECPFPRDRCPMECADPCSVCISAKFAAPPQPGAPLGTWSVHSVGGDRVETRPSPSQPEPVKHLDHDFEGADPNVCEYPYSMGVCGRPQNAHAPIVPENAGTTCSACLGCGGFDRFAEPVALGVEGREHDCNVCDGKGAK